MVIPDACQKKMIKRKKDKILRSLFPQQKTIDFSSNDYLGLAHSLSTHQEFIQEWEYAIQKNKNPFGATGSRLLCGNSEYAEQLESEIANFHKFETALLFANGYMANIGVFSSLPEEAIIVYDIYVHASIHDAIRLSKAQAAPFRHNCLISLEKILNKYSSVSPIFVCIESIYSMEGTVAPIKEIIALCQKYRAYLIVDEAHSIGIFGAHGQGLFFEHNLHQAVFALIAPFGKAFGSYGAAVLCSKDFKEYLINFARTFIYTTALPLYSLVAVRKAYSMMNTVENKRAYLKALIHYFIKKATTYNIWFSCSYSPIQVLILNSINRAQDLAYYLIQYNFDVRAITAPTVKRNKERLRINLHSFNTEKEIDMLFYHIAHFFNRKESTI